MKKEDVLFALDAIATPLSLYEPVYQDGGDTLYLMDQVKDKKNKEDSWVESIALKEAMEHLPDREYDIIKMRFFEGKTQTEVADEIAISQAQVSRLEKNALKTHEEPLSVILQYLIVYVSSSKYTPRSNRRSKKNRDCCKPICFRRKRHSNTIDVHTIQSRDHRWQFQNNRDRCQEFHNLIQVIINDRSKQRHRTSQDIMINISHLHRLFILNDDIFQQFFIFFIMSKANMFS